MTTTYTSYERANLAYKWCYPDVAIPEPYDADDSPEACESAVVHFLSHIHKATNAHPIKRKYHNARNIIQAFNERFPVGN